MARLLSRNIFQSFSDFGGCSALVRNVAVGREARWWSNEASPAVKVTAPRTSLNQPGLQTEEQLGLWYTLEQDIAKQLFGLGGIPKQFATQCKTFAETCLMIRKPALTTIDYIKKTNLALPPNKFILYGREGVGKSLSLVHITHFLSQDNWLLVHIPWAPRWRRGFKEITASATVPGRYDHPLDAVIWLQHFKSQNSQLLKTLQLETSEEYKWSRREVTEAGAPLIDIVELGISRARFASDCIMAVTTELKKHATHQRCKIAVVADGINTFFCLTSRYRLEDLTYLNPENFTIFQAFMQLFNNNWRNGVVVASVDSLANDGARRESYLPRYLLRQKGWETLDPFIPILVSNYNELEMQSIVDYYVDRNWLQNPGASSDTGRRELAGLSSCNPYTLMNICNSL
ncbi:hypothetical protein OTU49_008890 [Cherax quadricarinatus]|uniref:Small ribosomal subunit protein mS29 n=1 Tax=Cherax quadricarinatus TaxID=27406 RepID=A0AAW0WPM9_CHEQU